MGTAVAVDVVAAVAVSSDTADGQKDADYQYYYQVYDSGYGMIGFELADFVVSDFGSDVLGSDCDIGWYFDFGIGSGSVFASGSVGVAGCDAGCR